MSAKFTTLSYDRVVKLRQKVDLNRTLGLQHLTSPYLFYFLPLPFFLDMCLSTLKHSIQKYRQRSQGTADITEHFL